MVEFLREAGVVAGFKRALILLLLCLSFSGISQVYYSINPKYLKVKKEQNNLVSRYKYSYPDTTLTEFSNFSPRNFMGNIGLPSPNLLLTYGTDNIGFRFFQPPTVIDKYRENEIEYYRSKGPYANLTGIAGSKQMQSFDMLFTHTYRDKVNITLKFNRYTSLGYYSKQQTYNNKFFMTSNFTEKKKRYGYYFYLLNNSNKNQENGGISDRSLNDSTYLISKELFPVRLSGANRDNRETKVMINPWLKLNTGSDSTHLFDHFLQIKSKFSTSSYRYKDKGIKYDKFYKNIFSDSTLTLDSSHVQQFMNEINYTLLSANHAFGFSAGYRNELSKVWQKMDTVFLNHMFYADLNFSSEKEQKDTAKMLKPYVESRFNYQYVMAGSNTGNFKIENNSAYHLKPSKHWTVFFNALIENRTADYIYHNWSSNNFIWNSRYYEQQKQVQAQLGINFAKVFRISVMDQSIKNFLYFDSLALPAQYKGSINNLVLDVNFTKLFFKHLGVALDHKYQLTSKPSLVRVPQNITTAKLFYNGNLFKNNLQLQIGTQVQLYDAFTTYDYMPSTQVFYLQDKIKTSQYPYLDVYLNARIHPVSFFLKMENALQGLAGPAYFFVPGYYQTDRTFRFGISWMFFD